MEDWKFRVENTPTNVLDLITSQLAPMNGIVFQVKPFENNTSTFKIRKRIQYAWYMLFLNSIVVDGRLLNTENSNDTEVQITFRQHFLWKLIIFTEGIVGMAVLITILKDGAQDLFLYSVLIALIGLGSIFWITVRRKFKSNVQEYKTLILSVLDLNSNKSST